MLKLMKYLLAWPLMLFCYFGVGAIVSNFEFGRWLIFVLYCILSMVVASNLIERHEKKQARKDSQFILGNGQDIRELTSVEGLSISKEQRPHRLSEFKSIFLSATLPVILISIIAWIFPEILNWI